jgi:hypothetical protein
MKWIKLKKLTLFPDAFDAFRLSLKYYGEFDTCELDKSSPFSHLELNILVILIVIAKARNAASNGKGLSQDD